MSFFTQSGDLFAPTPGRDSLLDRLPGGNYIIVETMSGLVFRKVDDFKAPGRMYGPADSRVDRILNTFLDRPRSTGVLLSGEKGSGKSQLARNVSFAAKEQGIPTIIINAPWHGDPFNTLLASIEQPAIVLMDEFEKVYQQQPVQEQVLTLLDGMMTSQKLFILTVNDKYRVNTHMQNRPGRIYYSLEFSGLEPEFIREYCQDNLDDQDQIDNILKIASLFSAFNFDMLKAMCEELNRYKESAFEVIEWLNAKPLQVSASTSYEVVATSSTGTVSNPRHSEMLPMQQPGGQISMYLDFPADADVKTDSDNEKHFLIPSDALKKMDVTNGIFEFEIDDDFKITFTRKTTRREIDYSAF